MRKLATIQEIADVQPIENADAIEKVKIKDWWVVSQKNTFKKGDICVYFEIDSLLPVDNENFEFLGKGSKPKDAIIDGETKVGYGYRLKTVKLRGQVSQGFALPINNVFKLDSDQVPKIGTDISSLIGVVKYEPPIPANLAGKVKGRFPGFLNKTDEERVQNLGEVVSNGFDDLFYVSEKLDGSSSTYYKRDGEFGVCSRNLELLDTPENTLWEMARKYDLENILPDNYAIQAELIGEGIQKNHYEIQGHDIYVFNVFDIKEQKYLDFEDMKKFCEDLNLKTVPILEDKSVIEKSEEAVDSLLRYAEGNSILNENVDREGVVFRPLIENTMSIDGILTRMSFKAISNKFLLKHED